MRPGCTKSLLSNWEQGYLKTIVFGGGNPQSYFSALIEHQEGREHLKSGIASTSSSSASASEPSDEHTLSFAEFTDSLSNRSSEASNTHSAASHSLTLGPAAHYMFDAEHPSVSQATPPAPPITSFMAGQARKRPRTTATEAESEEETPYSNTATPNSPTKFTLVRQQAASRSK